MQLVYRGQTIHCPAQPVASAMLPKAMNWRYQVTDQPCADPSLLSAPKHYQPHAMNWRFESVLRA